MRKQWKRSFVVVVMGVVIFHLWVYPTLAEGWVDSDKDYLWDDWEKKLGTDPNNPDSDGDLYLDGTEVAASYDPLNPKPLKLKKRIEVDLKKQELSFFSGEKEIDRFLISGGLPGWPTPKGDFEILLKELVWVYKGPGYYYPNTKWNLLFTKQNGWRYWIHGAYWHNSFGKPKSHGCVNVSYQNIERLYWWTQIGTNVHIF